jgi:hypothetical protein
MHRLPVTGRELGGQRIEAARLAGGHRISPEVGSEGRIDEQALDQPAGAIALVVNG